MRVGTTTRFWSSGQSGELVGPICRRLAKLADPAVARPRCIVNSPMKTLAPRASVIFPTGQLSSALFIDQWLPLGHRQCRLPGWDAGTAKRAGGCSKHRQQLPGRRANNRALRVSGIEQLHRGPTGAGHLD